MQLQDVVGKYFELLKGRLAEREMRIVAGALAKVLPRGGVTLVSQASNLSRPTIYDGFHEIEVAAAPRAESRQRKVGAGRKSILAKDAGVISALRSLISPYEHGDPESPLLWVSKSLRKLSVELKILGHNIGHVTVGKMLESMGFTLQSNKRSHASGDCPDRDEQFTFIANAVKSFFADGQPVVSVDAKKKELIGNFKNSGREYREKGKPELVEVYDFINENGRATPYGVYDIGANEGYVNVGISHDTAAFAVDTISLWSKSL